MLQTAPTVLNNMTYAKLLVSASQALSPTAIRRSIADLIGQDRLSEADALSCEAMMRFPKSEDILVVRALVTQIRHDWHAANATLENLIALQGQATQAVTWSQWVRVLRCMGNDARAMSVAAQGLANHPGHSALIEEFNDLQQLGFSPVQKAA